MQAAEIVAQLSVRHGVEAIAFYERAFGASVDYRVGGTEENASVVAQLSIGGSSFWVADESPSHENFSPESLGGGSVRMLLIVEDPVGVVAEAVRAGAREVRPVGEEHGWVLGRLADPFGHHWEVGKPVGLWPPSNVQPAP